MQAESPLARHEVRPPVKHAYGVPLEERKEIEAQLHRMMEEKIEDPYQPFIANEGEPQMFQHEHLTTRRLTFSRNFQSFRWRS